MKKYWIVAVVILITECQPSTDLSSIIRKSKEIHGGNRYLEVKSIEYQKEIWALAPANDTISHHVEWHYVDFENNHASMTWNKDSIRWVAKRIHDKIEVTQNGTPIENSETLGQLRRQVDGAQFVFWQPFKFINDTSKKEYVGKKTLFNGWKVYQVVCQYPESPDRWYFFFDQETFQLRATGVWHNQRYSLITNDRQETETGLLLHHERNSYFTDSLFQPKQKSTTYRYRIKNIQF